jgi:hypothetical protein
MSDISWHNVSIYIYKYIGCIFLPTDGKMLFTSSIDPLFLVLPYLQKAEKVWTFTQLYSI